MAAAVRKMWGAMLALGAVALSSAVPVHASLDVLPEGPADPPTIVGVTTTERSLTVTLMPPTYDGGSAVGSYEVRATASSGETHEKTGWDITSISGLVPGETYTVTARAYNSFGPSAYSSEVSVTLPFDHDILSVAPARLVDTRRGYATVDGLHAGIGRLAAGEEIEFAFGLRAGLPVDAKALMLNVSVVSPASDGFVTVFPCGQGRPLAASMTFGANQTLSNGVVAKPGAQGKICVFSMSSADIVIDVNGYVPATSAVESVVPARLADTRPRTSTVDGLLAGWGFLSPGQTLEVPTWRRGDVPYGARAVLLNVTAVDPVKAGYLTVFPCGQPLPLAANLTYSAGQTISNSVLAKVGASGKVCIYSMAMTDVVVDVNGFVPAEGSTDGVVPGRMLDTRPVPGDLVGLRVRAGQTIQVGGWTRFVPANARSVMLNVAVTEPDTAGFLTVFSCGDRLPLAASMTFEAGQTISNAVLAAVDKGICIFAMTGTHIVVDVTGYA